MKRPSGNAAVGVPAREVMRQTGIPYSTLNYWARTGFFEPTVARGTGTGNDRLYSLADIAALKVIVQLNKAGMPVASLRAVCKHLRRHGISPDYRWLIISGTLVERIPDSSALLQAVRTNLRYMHIVVDLLVAGSAQ